MFSYYGSKSKIIDLYPPPQYDTIIEPFAGSARYALKYWDRNITIVDKYEVVIKVWKYLQQASEKDILGLPRLTHNQSVDDFDISIDEKLFLGFCISQGNAIPKKKCVKFAAIINPNEKTNNVNRNIDRAAKMVQRIRHWNIVLGDYRDIENEICTWFIDPPYQFGGHEYKHSNKQIDFTQLSDWCQTREGQVIVCENTKADWIPFKKLTQRCDNSANAHGNKTTEAIWTNQPTSYGVEQGSLFSIA